MAALVAPIHQTMSASVPGPKVRRQDWRSTAYPSSGARGAGGEGNQVSVRVQRGRETRQWLALSPRTMRPSSAMRVRTLGRIEVTLA
jgi:hypothetical protein